ncbi:MAG: hypothetical protein GXX10_05060 [Clostridiaceae bacterium]|nr:hypothetical protein [Clostridiaceae bacterium]
MAEISFKKRVMDTIIKNAKLYKEKFVDYEYIICSEAFQYKEFYIISANEDNYQHLTGVHSLISAKEFFIKSYNGTLQESDFDFIKRGQSESAVKGSVRRKISVLPNIVHIFDSGTKVQENFIKNKVNCSFATADGKCTLGFVDCGKSRPMSLIKGDELDRSRSKEIALLLRKHVSKDKFDELIVGDLDILNRYLDKLEGLIDDKLIQQLNTIRKLHIAQEEVAVSDDSL